MKTAHIEYPDNFEKGNKAGLVHFSKNCGRDWDYKLIEQEDQDVIHEENSHTTGIGSNVSRYLGTVEITRVYKNKAAYK